MPPGGDAGRFFGGTGRRPYGMITGQWMAVGEHSVLPRNFQLLEIEEDSAKSKV